MAAISSLPRFATQWQVRSFEKRRVRSSELEQLVINTLDSFVSGTAQSKPIEGLKKIELGAKSQQLSIFLKIAYAIAKWITQYVFRAHHAFYEEALAIDWKMHTIVQLSQQLSVSQGSTTSVHPKVLAGQLIGFSKTASKSEIITFYKDIQAAGKLAKIVQGLSELSLIEASENPSPEAFKELDDPVKTALIEIAERANNHSLADQIRSLKKLNPVVLKQLNESSPSLVDLALEEYQALQAVLYKQYQAFAQTSDTQEIIAKLNVPGTLDKVLGAHLSDVYEVGINRLANPAKIEEIFQKMQEVNVRVTHVGVEYASFLKQGGLGEALEGLAEAMSAEGAQVRMLFPLYSSIKSRVLAHEGVLTGSFINATGDTVTTYTIIHKGVEVVFIDHEDFKLDRESPNIYDGDITSRSRFARFCQCASSWLYQNKEQIDVIHLHDWHVATIAKTLATDYPQAWKEGQMACVFTAHNNSRAAQGRCMDELAVGAYSYGLGLNPMLEALRWSDMVTTVSEVFAREIQLPERGEGLDPVMRRLALEGRLVGILNGSNPGKWNPATDAQLKKWSLTSSSQVESLTCSVDEPDKIFEKKQRAKELLSKWLDQQRPLLDQTQRNKQLFNAIDPQKPLFGVVTRYDSYQKGLDFYEAMIESVLAKGGQIMLLGSQEDTQATRLLDALVKKYEGRQGVVIVRDEKIESGGYRYQGGTPSNAPIGSLSRLAFDVMFMTPRYEPSGLTQYEGFGFGSLVFASATGGLEESITTPEQNTEGFNGWLFNRALGVKDLQRSVGEAMNYLQTATRQERAQKMAFVMREAALYGWSCSKRRISPIKQYFTVYEAAMQRAQLRGQLLAHNLMDRFKTVAMPATEPMAKLNPEESEMALRAFIGAGNRSPLEMKGPLARSMPVAFGEGICKTLHEQLGPQRLKDGTFRLTVMAPQAKFVSAIIYKEDGNVKGTFPLVKYEGGIWQTGLDLPQGTMYRLLIDGNVKIDPYARSHTRIDHTQPMFSVLYDDEFKWTDDLYMENRSISNKLATANMMEVFPQTWAVERGLKTWSQLVPSLITHAKEHGLTHIELMGVLSFPYIKSMGYQPGAHFAPDYRLGTPEEFKKMIDGLHNAGIGVIVDFVPGHVATDEWCMGKFDGSPLYEISGLQKLSIQALGFRWGHHMNLGSNFVQAHLLSAANWLMQLHVDGLRVDAVRSMLGHHDPAAAKLFLQHLNSLVQQNPGCFTIAEDYSNNPLVLKPLENKGLGFDGRWNVGWKHHAQCLIAQDPSSKDSTHLVELVRQQSGPEAQREVKYLSHDELSPGSSSLLERVCGEKDIDKSNLLQSKCAKLAAFIAMTRLLPGATLMFMGAESFSEYSWFCADPHFSAEKAKGEASTIKAKLADDSRKNFYRQLQMVIEQVGEQVSCQLKHTSGNQAAISYELLGKNMKVLVLTNFSNRAYTTDVESVEAPCVLPLSVKVISLDKSSMGKTLWDTSDVIAHRAQPVRI